MHTLVQYIFMNQLFIFLISYKFFNNEHLEVCFFKMDALCFEISRHSNYFVFFYTSDSLHFYLSMSTSEAEPSNHLLFTFQSLT